MPENNTNVMNEATTVVLTEEATTVVLTEEATTVVDLAEETTVEATTVEMTTVEHKIAFTPDGLEWSLPIMGKGMLGIFIVTTIIVGVTVILNKATTPRKNKQGKYSPDNK